MSLGDSEDDADTNYTGVRSQMLHQGGSVVTVSQGRISNSCDDTPVCNNSVPAHRADISVSEPTHCTDHISSWLTDRSEHYVSNIYSHTAGKWQVYISVYISLLCVDVARRTGGARGVLPGASCPAALDVRGLWTLVPAGPEGRGLGGSWGRSAGGGSHAEGVGVLGGYRPLGGVRRSKGPGTSPLLLTHHWTGEEFCLVFLYIWKESCKCYCLTLVMTQDSVSVKSNHLKS